LAGAATANVLWARRAPQVRYRVDFKQVPTRIGDMTAERVPVDQRIFNYLGADAMDELEYKSAQRGARLSLVYGTDWRAVHSPLSCLPQQGWQVQRKQQVDIPAPAGCPHPGPLHGQVLEAERGDQFLTVLYVFAHRGGTTGDWVKQGWAVAQSPPGTGGLMLSLSAYHRPGEAEAARELLEEVLTSAYVPAVSFWYR
jgi:hypothetical protein